MICDVSEGCHRYSCKGCSLAQSLQENKSTDIFCDYCGFEIYKSDKVVKEDGKIYHDECYEEMELVAISCAQ